MESFDYVILGAGLGGLAAAACLTRQGYRVAVLEKHYLPGGCCHTFDYGDYRFCADVHYISQCGSGETIGQFLNYIERNVPFNSLDPDCIDRIVTPEVDFRIPLGWEVLRDRLLATFPDEAEAINLYCDEIKLLHQQIHDLVREVRWYDQKWSDWLKLPKYWHLFLRRNWTLQDLYDHVGLSPKLQALLAGQSGDYALPPNEIALLTHTSLVWDYSEGAYYPRHHFKHFVDTIVEAITAGGGVVQFSTPVEHIEVRDRTVQFVTALGTSYAAKKAYISDLDPKLTVQLMHDTNALSAKERDRLTSYEYSASAFNIYLGLDSRFDPQRYGIGNWNIWYYPTGDLNHEYQQQLQGNFQNPWIFLSCPTMKSREPGMAPEGHHVLEIATVCPYEPFKQLHETDLKAYKAKKREVYQALMASVRHLIPDVDAYARMKVYGTPTTSEFYLGQPQGNIYGAKLVPRQVGLNRLGYTTELPNLFFVGASAGYPSVPGVIGNGMDVAELITGQSVWSRAKPAEQLVRS
ncbi:MAG: NAD(P)/FAD-dependent oxidoreductase [Chlorogloeopsis fritschii C42_A2020_084]|jgi:all-trans-retinol 13,14-reductase|uniref:phytoene desaturase family protein n=1 Tax=Chlorogloeopsis fritschii TaxID=1124 RepID=UPI0019ECF910|nr:NAD(P)/FAD-dependent oxidoreductase [Chlorogloeopsis fritschii]MBF2005482.1 NAD(P)/FAD-dependent oxidoreductase [Chlorogloeopsis fritschii C42_A2020_084]